MADEVDIANDQVQYLLDVALQRRATAQIRPSAEFCDCGDEIPLLRRVAIQGCDTCIACQELRERRR